MFRVCCILLCVVILFCDHNVISVDVQMRGDVIIGAIFPVKNEEKSEYDTRNYHKFGIQYLETFFYAIDKVNKLNMIPGVKFGGHSLDNLDVSKDETLLTQFTKIRDEKEERGKQMFLGIIDGSGGNASTSIKTKLTKLNIPTLIVPTDYRLFTDKSEYDMAARAFTSTLTDYDPIIAILKKMNINKVQIIVTHTEEYRPILDYLVENGIQTEKIYQMLSPGTEDCEKAVDGIIAHKSIRTILLSNQIVDGCIFETMNKKLPKNDFQWISDHPINVKQLNDFESTVKGLIYPNFPPILTMLRSNEMPEYESFINYSKTLKPTNNKRNIWFREFFEEEFKCYSGRWNKSETRIMCGDGIRFQFNEMSGYYETIFNGIYAYVYAFKNAWLHKCGETLGICKELREMDGKQFFNNYLLKVNFTDITGNETFRFYKKERSNSVDIKRFEYSLGKYQSRTIGRWQNSQLLYFREKPCPESASLHCNPLCSNGYFQVRKADDDCCWSCKKCASNEYVVNETECKACEEGKVPNKDATNCIPMDFS
ncbi:metabotropic glutamate receptor 3-like protein, partial [Leptotrombidium deliense]